MSLDANVAAASPEEARAKSQLEALVGGFQGADEKSAAVDSGPFVVSAWEPGKRATLEANKKFREGRPFVDAIEITMGRSASERLLDLELNKTDLIKIAPQDARRAAEQGVRISASRPDELLALVMIAGKNAGNAVDRSGKRPANDETRAREAIPQTAWQTVGQAISLAIDRPAIVNFILQKTGEPAGGLLPQWSSGTAFLFPAATPSAEDLARAKELWKQITPSPQLVLGYDSADPLEQSVAERIVVNAKEAGISLTARSFPYAVLTDAISGTQTTHIDAKLVRWRMESPIPANGLNDFLGQMDAGSLGDSKTSSLPESGTPEEVYKKQRAVLDSYRIVPIAWLPQVYGLSPRVRDWQVPGPGENWPLADVWLDTAGTGADPR
jgi:ABC-type transport system substrate-binding protein